MFPNVNFKSFSLNAFDVTYILTAMCYLQSNEPKTYHYTISVYITYYLYTSSTTTILFSPLNAAGGADCKEHASQATILIKLTRQSYQSSNVVI